MSFDLKFMVPTMTKAGSLEYFQNKPQVSVDEIIVENCLIELDVNKCFLTELEMLKWLMDHQYALRRNTDLFSIYAMSYQVLERIKSSSSKNALVAVWIK